MSFDFVNFDDMPDSVEYLEQFAQKHSCKVDEQEFWEILKGYSLPYSEDSTNLYLNMLYENAKQELIKQGIDEDCISYYTNCLDSHFYINDIEIQDHEDIEKALKDSFIVKIEVLDYTDLKDLEDGANDDKIKGGDAWFYEKIADKMQEKFFEVHNIRAEFRLSVDFPDEYDNDVLYFIFYPEEKMSEYEVKLLKTFINRSIKPMLRKNIRASK